MADPLTSSITIDLQRIRQNAAEIVRQAGVPVYAVVKADAYGCGMQSVAKALADVVQGFCVFNLAEAKQLRVVTTSPILCLGPPGDATADEFLACGARPSVSNADQARRLAKASPALCVDTGMQRFTCPPENVAEVLAAGRCTEAFTHAIRPEQVTRLIEIVGGRDSGLKLHAAGSSLWENESCRLDAIRPGLALYRGAVKVTAPLVEVHQSRGPAGYTSFVTPRHGVILRGYHQGLRPGPCQINGRRSRVIEVGMQSAFVETSDGDKVGDLVVLIGDGLEADEIGAAWKTSAQQVLVSLLRKAGQ